MCSHLTLTAYLLEVSAKPSSGRCAISKLGNDLGSGRKYSANMNGIIIFRNIERKLLFFYLL